MRPNQFGSTRVRALLVAIAALAVSAFAAPAAFAAAPLNDNFASGIDLPAGVDIASNNVDATAENGEPDPLNSAFNFNNPNCGATFDPTCSTSVWYDWTAPGNGTFTFQTCGSDLDTVVGVYTGSNVNSLTLAGADAEDDDTACGTTELASVVSFSATTGAQFHILVAGFEAQEGDFQLSSEPPPPFTPPVVTSPSPTPAATIAAPATTTQGQKKGGKKKCHKHKGGHKGGGKNRAYFKKCGGHKGGSNK